MYRLQWPCFGQWDLSLLDKNRRSNQTGLGRFFSAVNALTALCIVMSASVVHAVGLGAAQSVSYIGEPLNIKIPLFNVVNPNELKIQIQNSNTEGNAYQVLLDRSNSQLAVLVRTDEVVFEPFVSFSLLLEDQSARISKEFNVLLDLNPEPVPVTTNRSIGARTLQSQSLAGDEIMGPYDWAETGRIAARFGPVLDGQSLWRVARRINQAMGVTREQVMWSLYQSNPDAFASRNIESLKAGSILHIPTQEKVSATSHSQALALLAGLKVAGLNRSESTALTNNTALVVENNASGQPAEIPEVTTREQAPEPVNNLFDISAVATPAPTQQTTPAATVTADATILSLAKTVGELSQELIRKDQKIDQLEAELSTLRAQSELGQTNPLSEVSNEAATAINSTIVQSETVTSNRWWWITAGLMTLAVAATVFRERLLNLASALNLFGRNRPVNFDDEPLANRQTEQQNEPSLGQRPRGKDFSIMQAVEHQLEDNEPIEGISYLDLADEPELPFDDGSFVENDLLDLNSSENPQETDEVDLSFDERFERLLEEKDFEFARELLDFARYSELNDDRYHCERLRLLKCMDDEDGFYEYYYEIESKIPTFPPRLQTEISQFVVQLAHSA